MEARNTTSVWHGLGAKATGCGSERHSVCGRAFPAEGFATCVSKRSGVNKI